MKPAVRRPVVVVLLVLLGLALGAVPAAAATGAATVRGVLVDRAGHPLAGVLVTAVLQSDQPNPPVYGAPARTDADGRYVVRGIDTTGWADGLALNLQVDPSAAVGGDSPTGYAAQCLGGAAHCDRTPAGQSRLTVTVTAGHTTAVPRTALVEAAVLTGRLVENGTGRSVSGYPVSVWSGYEIEGLPQADGVAVSDGNGTWRIGGLFPQPARACFGDFTVAGAPNVRDGYVGQCWRGHDLLTEHQGDDVGLRARKTTTLATVGLRRNGGVAGRVVDRAGHPVAGLVVAVGDDNRVQDDPAALRQTVTGADGTYRVAGVRPGEQPVCVFPADRPTSCVGPHPHVVTVRPGRTTAAPPLVYRPSA